MHNVFIEEINTTALRSNDDKRMQSVSSIETYAYKHMLEANVIKKTKMKIIQIDYKFLVIIYTEY